MAQCDYAYFFATLQLNALNVIIQKNYFKRMHHLKLFKTSEITATTCSYTRSDPQTDVKRENSKTTEVEQ